MRVFKKVLIYTLAGITFLLSIGLIITMIGKSQAEKELEVRTKIGPDGISELEEVEIEGTKQWIFIRGEKKDNPILLYIHGGPGTTHLSLARELDGEMEKDFIVVNWDQRSAGKSFSIFTPSSSLNKEQYLKDTYALVQLLKKRFNVPKIYIMGHSWGSYLAAITAHRHPEDFVACIGIGQMVNAVQNEIVSYNFVLAQAHKDKNKQAIAELEEIGIPPYEDFRSIGVERAWLGHYGGGMFYGKHRHDTYSYLGDLMMASPEYSLLDTLKFFAGMVRSLTSIWPEFFTLDLYTEAPSIDVPVYFMAGRHDYNTPWEIVMKYEKVLRSPKKTIIWFENSAHSPNYEEVDAFGEAMRRVKRETWKQQSVR